MKLIIDIPEAIYKTAQKTNILEANIDMLAKTIRNGTPIPDNATNGDVIKAFYPDAVVGSNNLGKVIFLRPNATVVIEDRMSDWWNAPYQKGGKK